MNQVEPTIKEGCTGQPKAITKVTLTAAQWDSFLPFAQTPQQKSWAESFQDHAVSEYTITDSWRTRITLGLFLAEADWVKANLPKVNEFQRYKSWLVQNWEEALEQPDS